MKFLTTLLLAASLAAPAYADFTTAPMSPPPQAEFDKVLADPDCELFDGYSATDAWEGTTLDATTRVHIVPCFMGAYNVMSKILIERRAANATTSTFDTASFADYGTSYGWIGTDMLTNAFINPETGHLAHFHKGRGLGDCGSTGSWEWNGYSFAMIEYRVEEDCNGRLPDEWPVLYSRASTASNETALEPETIVAETRDCSAAPFCEDRRYFKDWLTACRQPRSDGSRFCSANAYIHDTSAPAGFNYQLRVSRETRGFPLRVSLIAVFEMMNRAKPMEFRVDGERIIRLSPDEVETDQAVNDYFVGPQNLTDQLLVAMRAGSQLTVIYMSESGKRIAVPFSLAGLTASLLWIEENAGN